MKTIKFIAVAVCLLWACAARAQMGGPPLGAAPSTGTGFGTPPTSPNGAAFIACDVPAGGVAVDAFCKPGVKMRTNTGATDTIDCVLDRGNSVLETFNGAVAVSLSQAGSGNCDAGFSFFLIAGNAVGAVATPTITPTVGQNGSNGAALAANLVGNPGQVIFVYTDSSGANYRAAVIGGITGLTTGYVPQATSTSGLTNSPCDHITNAGAQTCQDAQIAPVYKTGSDPSSGIVKGTSAFYSGDEGTPPTGMPAASDTIQPGSANSCMELFHGTTDNGCLLSVSGTKVISGADYTNATTTPSTVFTWSLPATGSARTYHYSCDILWESTAATLTGPVFSVNLSAAPTQLTANAWVETTAAGTSTTGYLSNTTTGSQTLITSAAAGVTTTNYPAKIWGTIEGAAIAGSTFTISAAALSNTTSTLNIRRGGGCELH